MQLEAAGNHSGQDRPLEDQLALLRSRVRSLEGSRRELETHLAEKQLTLEHAQLTIREQSRELEKLRRIQAERACEETAELEPLHGPAPHAAAIALESSSRREAACASGVVETASKGKTRTKTSRISARSRARQRMESKTGLSQPEIPVPVVDDPDDDPGPPLTGQELVKRSGVMPSFRLEKAVSALSEESTSQRPHVTAQARKLQHRWVNLIWAALFAAIASGAVWLLFQLIRKEPYDQPLRPNVQRTAQEEVRLPESPPRVDERTPKANPQPRPARTPTPERSPEATPRSEPVRVADSGSDRDELETPREVASPPLQLDHEELQHKAERALETNDAFLFEELMRDVSEIGEEEFEGLIVHLKQNSKNPKIVDFLKTVYLKARDGRGRDGSRR